MAQLEFEDLTFVQEKNSVRVNFYQNHYFEIPNEELEEISNYKINHKSIEFIGINEKKARNKFNQLVNKGMQNLINSVTKKPSFFIYQGSDIPLIGSSAFGIVDRNSNLIEVKPITGCNMNCIFCSVDEGLRSKKVSEIVIEPGYLIDELRKVVEHKKTICHVTINSHGEPLTYEPMPELVKGIKEIPNLKTVSLITNATLLTEELIDKLAQAKLDYLNISLNAYDEKIAKILEGHGKYDVNKVLEMLRYASKKIQIIIAPVLLQGYNEKEMEKLAKFSKEINAKLAIQNFLEYKKGRNPAKQIEWDDFYKMMKELQDKYGTQTFWDAEDFDIVNTPPLEKPFKKGNKVRAKIMLPGRYPNEKIAVAQERNITIPNCDRTGEVTVKILRDKHNIFFGQLI